MPARHASRASRGLEPRLERVNDTNAALGNLAIYALAGRYAPLLQESPRARPTLSLAETMAAAARRGVTTTARSATQSAATTATVAARCANTLHRRRAPRPPRRATATTASTHLAAPFSLAARNLTPPRRPAIPIKIARAIRPDKSSHFSDARCRTRGGAGRAYCCLAPRAAYSLINCSACLRRWRCGGRGPAAVGVMPLFAGIAL